ncbi:hypothetical protein METBIDRAFT_32256 [Metschnikowia bicuspidata var. bicuspidata NRRL YB-4993]|uniref:Uncharacterized protein n=1 Tax=Metschnikowia bicuspidata var. bicuspidata NRRL YB-4993 TaxID=869754 RepID=A0A1A0H8C3_9ASCO|nr:hypothetical protein METBIDRAFT_32256 [Metschnikowia bicuspidata var. bicuspidata NRRL YB-4993]OBA20230.1 hypothetical protein METBIDRAFT_32256 [Metschnikowia bicuspidata var. bicuspidata NRRL YB-4993]
MFHDRCAYTLDKTPLMSEHRKSSFIFSNRRVGCAELQPTPVLGSVLISTIFSVFLNARETNVLVKSTRQR